MIIGIIFEILQWFLILLLIFIIWNQENQLKEKVKGWR